LDYEKISLSFK